MRFLVKALFVVSLLVISGNSYAGSCHSNNEELLIREAFTVASRPAPRNRPIKREVNGRPIKSEQLYKCPMHPEEVSNEPGRCNKCGMYLINEKTGERT